MELKTMENLDKKKFENAKERVKKEKDFYTHLTVYIVINSMLIIINLGVFQSGFTDIRIPKWPMFTTPFFWGIGLFFHLGQPAKRGIPYPIDSRCLHT